MNWGTKIVVVFGTFVAGIVFMVFRSSQQNTDLVMPDYYEQELKYQELIDASRRTDSLSSAIGCKVNKETIEIIFPEEMKGQEMKGMVWLYCVADKQKDLKKDFTSSSAVFHMPYNPSDKGLFAIKINWQAGGRPYYHEQKIFIQ